MPTIEPGPMADITVKYVNQPKPGKKLGNVKDDQGNYWFVQPAMLSQFAPGMKCKVEYKAGTFSDGTESRTVTKIIGGNLAPTVPKNDYRARSNPAEAKQIAVLALAKECIHVMAPEELSEDKLVAILTMCSRAYDRTLGGVQAQRRDDMDDNVNF